MKKVFLCLYCHFVLQQKRSAWEGAVRNLGFIYSPLIKKNQRVFDGYFHVADILPTFASAAGVKINKVDGLDQWNALVNGVKSPRKEVLVVLDNIDDYSGLIADEWKLVNGSVKRFNGSFDNYLGSVEEFPSPSNYVDLVLSSTVGKVLGSSINNKLTTEKISKLREKATINCSDAKNPINACNVLSKPCLFNILNDPCERKNLAEIYPAVLGKMLKRLKVLVNEAVPVRRTFISDRQCDPNLHNGTWTSWIGDSAY